MKKIIVIGAGLAGSEAAWQAAEADAQVELYEMRPLRRSPAHKTDGFNYRFVFGRCNAGI